MFKQAQNLGLLLRSTFFEVSLHSRGFGKMDQVAVRLVLGGVLTMRRPRLHLNDQYVGVYFEAEILAAA